MRERLQVVEGAAAAAHECLVLDPEERLADPPGRGLRHARNLPRSGDPAAWFERTIKSRLRVAERARRRNWP